MLSVFGLFVVYERAVKQTVYSESINEERAMQTLSSTTSSVNHGG